MKHVSSRAVLPALCLVLALVCPALAQDPVEPDASEDDGPVLVGALERERIEAAVPEWVRVQVESEIDAAAAQALAAVPPGAELTVYLGTWCEDSRREIPRLWRALDETGGLVPFEIRYVGVDREKEEPAELLRGAGLEYVPTLVVHRDGREVGRVVEESPEGIEIHLLALLTGEAEGVVSARDDLGGEPSGE